MPKEKNQGHSNSLTDHLSVATLSKKLSHFLNYDDICLLSRGAKKALRVEQRWREIFKKRIYEDLDHAIEKLAFGSFDSDNYDFQNIIIAHAIDSMKAGIDTQPKVSPHRFAKDPKNLRTIFEIWDQWRSKKKIPARQKETAEVIRKQFLHTVQSFWRKYADDFRRGESFDMSAAKEELRRQAKILFARANTVVNTETTVYYNQARKKIYENVPGITHWFFVAIRDYRTTKWCKTRDGLVYKNDTELLDRNVPPCHWNCRSEILPLSPSNPKHRALIDDKKRRAENNHPAPLPSGWKSR